MAPLDDAVFTLTLTSLALYLTLTCRWWRCGRALGTPRSRRGCAPPVRARVRVRVRVSVRVKARLG